jgi:hypothetical protein
VSQYAPITADLRERMQQLLPDAIARYEAFGRDDRREAALGLVVAGAAPLAGLLLGWEWSGVVIALLLNLALSLSDDILKILRSRRAFGEIRRERAEDEFAWPIAGALARGRQRLLRKGMPTLEKLEQRTTEWPLAPFAFLAYGLLGFCVMMLTGGGAVYGSGSTVFLGTLPSVLLSVGFGLLHGLGRHPHWRRAASVRLQSTAYTSMFVFFLGMGVMLVVATPQNPPLTERQLAWLACVTTIGYGCYRLWDLRELGFTVRVWKRRLGL